MSKVNSFIILVISMIMSGCSSITHNNIDIKSKNFGSAPNISIYQHQIERKIKLMLKDPDSAKIDKCIPPRKAYINNGEIVGWATLCMVNAKNSFGGYAGNKIWAAFIANDGNGSNILLNVEPSNAKNRTINIVQ